MIYAARCSQTQDRYRAGSDTAASTAPDTIGHERAAEVALALSLLIFAGTMWPRKSDHGPAVFVSMEKEAMFSRSQPASGAKFENSGNGPKQAGKHQNRQCWP